MGPSGSGKTTLLNCIAAIDTPDGGEIALAGTPVNFGFERARTRLRRSDIGVANTMLIQIRARDREFAALKSIRISRGQVVRSRIATLRVRRHR